MTSNSGTGDRGDDPGLDRRAVLRAAGALGAGALAGTAPAMAAGSTATDSEAPTQNDATPVRVLTRNCYLGADLSTLFAVRSESELPERAGALLATIDASHPAARMDAIASEIEATAPDLVGLQEVAAIGTKPPDGGAGDGSGSSSDGDGSGDAGDDNWNPRYDFLDALRSALDDRGLSYRVAASVTNVDSEFPAVVEGDRLDVRLTDRDVVLAREGVTTENPQTGRYDEALSVPVTEERAITVERGYAAVDATVDGTTVTFANTHLESVSTFTRERQAGELAALLESRSPVVLVGDLNSGPEVDDDATYRLLIEEVGFADLVGDARPDASLPTCCHAADLRNDASRLDRRIDHVLGRGVAGATAVTRVGATPADRVQVDAADGDLRLWPADHAGVAATVRIDPSAATTSAATTTTPTPTATTRATTGAATTTADATESTTTGAGDDGGATGADDDGGATETETPGFGAGAAAVGAGLAALYGALRSRR